MELSDEERMQIEAGCRADHTRGWSGIFPDRHCINAEVTRIKSDAYAAGRAAGLAQAEERIETLAIDAADVGGSYAPAYRIAAEVVANLRKGGE